MQGCCWWRLGRGVFGGGSGAVGGGACGGPEH